VVVLVVNLIDLLTILVVAVLITMIVLVNWVLVKVEARYSMANRMDLVLMANPSLGVRKLDLRLKSEDCAVRRIALCIESRLVSRADSGCLKLIRCEVSLG
jgi:hypothetical protein